MWHFLLTYEHNPNTMVVYLCLFPTLSVNAFKDCYNHSSYDTLKLGGLQIRIHRRLNGRRLYMSPFQQNGVIYMFRKSHSFNCKTSELDLDGCGKTAYVTFCDIHILTSTKVRAQVVCLGLCNLRTLMTTTCKGRMPALFNIRSLNTV